MLEIDIRPYIPEEDETFFKDSIRLLQDFERNFSPEDMLPGDEIVEPWLEHTLRTNAENDGVIYVATAGGEHAGFMNVRTGSTTPEEEIYSRPSRFAHVTDLQVFPTYRGHGVGSRLLDQAEIYARERDLPYTRLEVFAGNKNAIDIYEAKGYVHAVVVMVKPTSNEV